MKNPVILIVDDDPNIRFAVQKTFERKRYKTLAVENGSTALQIVRKSPPSVIFMDISMPDIDGLSVLKEIKEIHPEIPVVMITGYGTMQTAMKAVQLGAYEYLTKPLDVDKVRLIAERALEMVRLREKLKGYTAKIPYTSDEYELIGQTETMQEVYKKMGAAAASPNITTVLIQGESGTGKELVARAIHQNGSFPEEPFVAVNCTALPENLFESQLFGHEKGAFTGAHQMHQGLLEQARQGSIFLDEIGDLTPHLQQKLLRVLQEREFTRVGGHQTLKVEARFMAATHHNLAAEVRDGRFREDLYYRLNVMVIELPPLRKRREDIPLLANFFLNLFNQKLKKKIQLISPGVLDFLHNYAFPGNVRELENMIERAVILEKSSILSEASFQSFINPAQASGDECPPLNSVVFQEARRVWIDEFERRFVISRLKAHHGNVTEAAKEAQIQRQSFQRLMKKHGIQSSDFRNSG